MEILNNFSQIEVETPVDKIIRQIRDLITSGQLKAGDRLPSERKLSEKLGVGRTHLREALQKLEFYGILKTRPQSGTVVAGMGIPALEGLITDMLGLQGRDFKSLVETRVILESNIAQLAAQNRSDEDIIEIKNALNAHRVKIEHNQDAVEEDLLFHLKIAEAGKNSVLNSLMLIITPDIMQYFKKHNVCGEGRAELAVEQHEQLLQHIVDRNPDKAGEAIKEHLKEISEYVKTLKDGTQLNGNGVLTT
ncbi:FadR/GntR family transcriptional regulator [Ekhidna sp.]|uniref:FadR/GntR family transcriptional regulator n=1 Tax=Ekhidna sp. TaxID=2608089 RepID=UPI003B5055AF